MSSHLVTQLEGALETRDVRTLLVEIAKILNLDRRLAYDPRVERIAQMAMGQVDADTYLALTGEKGIPAAMQIIEQYYKFPNKVVA